MESQKVSTLHDHYKGKVKGTKLGPSTVLSDAEELKLRSRVGN